MVPSYLQACEFSKAGLSNYDIDHCVKSVRIRSYSCPHFRENADQNNYEYGQRFYVFLKKITTSQRVRVIYVLIGTKAVLLKKVFY